MAVGRAEAAHATPAEVAKVIEDLEFFGAPPEAIARVLAELAPAVADPAFRVHPDNVTAVKVFRACATQWRMVSLTTLDRAEVRQVGLDYAGLEATARLSALTLTPDDFTRIRIMEAEALRAWAETRR